jgi:hypothetical protein
MGCPSPPCPRNFVNACMTEFIFAIRTRPFSTSYFSACGLFVVFVFVFLATL